MKKISKQLKFKKKVNRNKYKMLQNNVVIVNKVRELNKLKKQENQLAKVNNNNSRKIKINLYILKVKLARLFIIFLKLFYIIF